jgi:hypothetical protein
MIGFEVERIEPVTLACRNRLTGMYTLSPFVWRAEDGTYQVMLRAVPRRDDEPRLKMAEAWHGPSADGLHFEMDVAPVLFPGPIPPTSMAARIPPCSCTKSRPTSGTPAGTRPI